MEINSRYKIIKRIGKGAFGEVFLGTDTEANKEVAIKVEDKTNKHPQLQYEYKVMRLLSDTVGIPDVQWYGETETSNVMVLDLLGPSLEEMFNYCKRKFTLKTV